MIKVGENLCGQIARRIAIRNAFRHTTNYRPSSFFCKRSSSSASKPIYDPLAKRPNQKCDPYGQEGKPLSMTDATMLKSTIHSQWTFEMNEEDLTVPLSLTRHFIHPDYLSGARFLHKIAAVAQINNHFPSVLSLERRIVKKNWQVVTSVRCRTLVLGGLSRHDFHLAMVSSSITK
jgi:pterin-4a-carbinolamine dehydratase